MSNSSTANHSRLVKWLLPLIIVSVATGAFFLLIKSKPQAPSRPVTEKVWSVQTVSAEPGNHQPVLTLYGKVESPRMTHMTAAVTAFVQRVDTDEGRAAEADQLLIQLDDRDARLLVEQRQADVDNYLAQIDAEKVRHQTDLNALKIEKQLQQLSLKTVERYQNLIKRKVSSQEQLDTARRDYHQQSLSITQREQAIADHPNRLNQLEAQLKRARSLLQAAELDLQRTQIRAPFTGRIASLNVAPGDRVQTGAALLSMYSQERLEVRAQIPNRLLPLLRQQIDAEIRGQANLDGQTLTLSLDRVAAAVGSGRAGVDALFRIENGTYLPEPGRSLAIKIQMPAVEQSIAVSPLALYGLNRVYLEKEGRMTAVEVDRIGDLVTSDGAERVLIRSPQIRAGDRIITTQLPNAISGLRVKDVTEPDVIAAQGASDE
ncbi:efflux RND transporter periplasmic adaptor subunit [Neptuniibacter halophilus]|uniref:efflux RND transporter periplasmic adaptor subunit n=1 Tax=Neptuniibacter halophilus TaxID=651666 RepID=UPI002572E4DE|nr:HlyD family efflux transporter periplasmic adaptor subunit [Neptuniibacter halophilus]